MVTGKSGYFDLAGSYGITLRVYWIETYDVSSNKSVVTIEKLQVKSSKYDGALYWLNGTVSVDGVVLATMSSAAGTHSAYITGLDKFADVKASGNTASWVSQEITHADDGSKSVPIAVSLRGFTPTGTAGDGWEVNTSYSVALTTIPRKSTFTVPDGTLGTAFQIAVDRKSTSFTHTITYTCGTVSGTVCTQSATEDITYTLPLSLAEQNTSGVSVSVAFKLQTYSGNTAIGEETKTVTMAIPESVKPSCVLTVTDHMGYADRYGSYVKGLSRFAVSIAAETACGAAIRSYNVTANGKQYTEAELVTDVISSTAYNTISASVTDTRSRTSSVATKTVNILDYAKPAITELSVVRCNADGTENPNGGCVKLTFSATVTPLNNLNGAEYFVHWKKHNAVDYSGGYAFDELYGQYSVTDHTYIIEDIDTTASYEVEVTIEDNHFGIVKKGVVPTAFALLHFRSDGTGVGIGKICEVADALDVGLLIAMNNKRITGIGAPTDDSDAIPRSYLDATGIHTSKYVADCNTATTSGWYYTNANTVNAPTKYCALFCMQRISTAYAQIAIDVSTGNIYSRAYGGSSWTAWKKAVDETALLDKVHPVGSYYISHTDTSPAELFGGTWHRIESRFLWGAPSTSTLGLTAGEQTHTLTASEMPSHDHDTFQRDPNAASNAAYQYMVDTYATGATAYGYAPTMSTTTGKKRMRTGTTGGGAAHNNMPPYVNVAIWRRTA